MQIDRIVLADDHPVFREGMRRTVQRVNPGAEIIEADSLRDMLRQARRGDAPGTFIIDLMFGQRSIEPHLPELRQEFSRSSIIVLSMIEERCVAQRILALGIDGFICKSLPPQQIAAAIEAVQNGDQVLAMSPDELPRGEEDPLPELTDRQLDVLRLLTAGKSNKEIALALDISPYTVRIHVSALLKALGVTSRMAAVVKATAYGIS